MLPIIALLMAPVSAIAASTGFTGGTLVIVVPCDGGAIIAADRRQSDSAGAFADTRTKIHELGRNRGYFAMTGKTVAGVSPTGDGLNRIDAAVQIEEYFRRMDARNLSASHAGFSAFLHDLALRMMAVVDQGAIAEVLHSSSRQIFQVVLLVRNEKVLEGHVFRVSLVPHAAVIEPMVEHDRYGDQFAQAEPWFWGEMAFVDAIRTAQAPPFAQDRELPVVKVFLAGHSVEGVSEETAIEFARTMVSLTSARLPLLGRKPTVSPTFDYRFVAVPARRRVHEGSPTKSAFPMRHQPSNVR
jgi:hypothetical protein